MSWKKKKEKRAKSLPFRFFFFLNCTVRAREIYSDFNLWINT